MHIPHVLHTGQRLWNRANSYASLWIELLHGWGFEPLAALACAIALDFDGDQFTVLSLPEEDLKVLYGVTTFRLAIYDRLEAHIATQTDAGNVVLADVDTFYLPDVPSLYGTLHGPTLVGIDRLDMRACAASYYRQGRRYELGGDDYGGIFRQPALVEGYHDALIRHVECAKRAFPPVSEEALAAVSVQLLRRHLSRVPQRSPIAAFRATLSSTLETLANSGETFRHSFAYGTLSQFGSHFELFTAYLQWLEHRHHPQPAGCIQASQRLVSESLVCQMRLLRATTRGKMDPCEDSLDRIETHYEELIACLRTS
ncbi:DUF1839 family protein [Robbsia sp. Bb-Pol-6]|uniref:DUF1839 family protein n=1 Tax=Robbsia betulipollinis TaxID=2981849 RepID=A0ABT3ZU29_9BURK|nr:DUF1839 family protein [Robbsia betulipollinis]